MNNNNLNLLNTLLIAIAPAIITSLIEGAGEWSNSRNFKKSEAMKAIHSFRQNVENKINNPSTNYFINISRLSNSQLQKLVMFLSQWSVYMINNVASKKIIKQAIGYELLLCLFTLLPTANRLSYSRNINGYFKLIKQFHISDIRWYNHNSKGRI